MTTVAASPSSTSGNNSRIVEAYKQSFFAAIVTLLLAVPMVGIVTHEIGGGYDISFRWQWVVGSVFAVAAGRFFLVLSGLLPWLNAKQQQACEAGTANPSAIWKKIQPLLFIGVIIALVLLPHFAGRTWINWGTLVLLYLTMAWGLNIVVGLAGLLDLGYIAFAAIGAYTVALLGLHLDLSFWYSLPIAVIVAGCFGFLLGLPILRLRGDYLAIVTLAFAEMVHVVLVNWQSFTGGSNGVGEFSRPTLFGLEFSRQASNENSQTFHDFFNLPFSGEHRVIFTFYLVVLVAFLVNALALRLRRLPLGRAWEAMREDEIACRSLGINLPRVKLSAYVMGALVGGLAGAFFAAKEGFVSPNSFNFLETAKILAIVVLGGMGSQAGIAIAAIFLVLLPEVSREFAEYRMLFFGAAMVLVMVWRPGGLISMREPSLRLHK